MANVYDVADYILHKQGHMTAMKLQKLVYYSQAWSLVWDEAPIFNDKIEAWANGPVVPNLFNAHRGEFRVAREPRGHHHTLTADQKETVDAILKYYGDKGSQWLSDLTHREDPWRDARVGLADGHRGNVVITHGALADYYSNI